MVFPSPDLLKEKNYALYKFYLTATSETDVDVRNDNLKSIMNDVIDTLEYYIKDDNLSYIYEFAPTHSFIAINSYINLMLNFFKSWKTYFLSPTITYTAEGDMKDNRVGNGDKLREYAGNIISRALNTFQQVCYAFLQVAIVSRDNYFIFA